MVLSTAYFPNIQYFTKIALSETVYIECHENYQRQSYRNRCHIYSSNGLQVLSVPIEKHTESKKISDIKIAYHTLWQKNHWRSIVSAYNNSPYFEHYSDHIAPIFSKRYKYLLDLNFEILETCLKLLGIGKTINKTETYQSSKTVDWRNGIHPKSQYQIQDTSFRPYAYYQVFADKHGFQPNLSIIDTIFCEGVYTTSLINRSINQ